MKTILGATALFVLAGYAAFAQQPFQIDHFKGYFPQQVTQVQPAQVVLQDQFGTNPAVIGKIFRLLNPTRKFHNGVWTPIAHPDDHLVMHVTGPQPLVNREVKIRNQFGDQVLTTQDARVLAVPTQKDPHGPPQQINHFSCYAVSNGPLINQPVALADQFFGSQHNVLRPVFFCNPVQKTHDGVVSPITNPNDHLTCYNITRVPFVKVVTLHNQFGDHKFQSAYADLLCVPTEKVNWRVID